MPAETPLWTIPYTIPDDAVADYPTVSLDVAQSVDAQLTALRDAREIVWASDGNGIVIPINVWTHSPLCIAPVVPAGAYIVRYGATLEMPEAYPWQVGLLINPAAPAAFVTSTQFTNTQFNRYQFEFGVSTGGGEIFPAFLVAGGTQGTPAARDIVVTVERIDRVVSRAGEPEPLPAIIPVPVEAVVGEPAPPPVFRLPK